MCGVLMFMYVYAVHACVNWQSLILNPHLLRIVLSKVYYQSDPWSWWKNSITTGLFVCFVFLCFWFLVFFCRPREIIQTSASEMASRAEDQTSALT